MTFTNTTARKSLLIGMCMVWGCGDNGNMVGSASRSHGGSAGQPNVTAGLGGANGSSTAGTATNAGSGGTSSSRGGNATAGSAQGGLGGASGGTAPSAGQAGAVGRTCEAIKADYAVELTKAKRCEYGEFEICSATILDTPDCGCMTNVSKSASLVKLNQLQDEWVQRFCTQSGCPRECAEPEGICEHPQGQTVGSCSD